MKKRKCEHKRKKGYFCPICKKFVEDWYADPWIIGRSMRVVPGSGLVVKVCKKCNTVLMEFVED